MNPYYSKNGITIYNEDCLEAMKRMSDKSIDLVLADPPYNVGQNFANDNLGKKEYLCFMQNWIAEAYRLLKDGGAFYMFHYFIGMWDIKPILDNFEWEFINLIIWAYPNLMPSNKRKNYRWPLSYQPIFYYGKNYKRDLVGKLYGLKVDERKDVWLKTATQSNFKKEFKYHSSCKPIAVIEKIIKTTEESDIILDPFLGSGTTLVACKKFGRQAIGIEISKEYCDISIKRLTQEYLKL
ncbi:hypothetical protein COS91_01545 [Candidatus Desantisbacteria bacterium CG07_land_8_20_14_0_80_39_15]|uniref:Methyltransferase n=1 Tax=Candidatus Desantisbacteria bacterium CG07_land_8_20_14_0_80_39_15 TaxID=1974549 RepID=A0A2M6ZHY6_9BACT|nr:MAG: hypothetical protein COS91_01545 [Candidatus Desantisbacteria bacterium CG07_land_8_20_14_0_80_39_15]